MGLGWPRQAASAAVERRARGVVWTNVANLAAFTVASDDSVTYAANDVVILAAQTTATERGPWTVGAVAAGVAPLTRPSWWASGASIASGTTIEVGGAGTIFGGSTWKALRTTATTVDTHDPELYPRVSKQSATYAAGQVTHGAGGNAKPLFMYSSASSVNITYKVYDVNSNGTIALRYTSATPGVAGTAAIALDTTHYLTAVTDAANVSEVWVLVTNW